MDNQMSDQPEIIKEPQSGVILDLATLFVSAFLLAMVGASYLLFNWLMGVLSG